MEFVRLEKHEDGVLFAFIDNPHSLINTLSEPVISEIESVLDEVGTDHFAKALIFISAKEDKFIVGADIQEMSEPGPARTIHPCAYSFQPHRQPALPIDCGNKRALSGRGNGACACLSFPDCDRLP